MNMFRLILLCILLTSSSIFAQQQTKGKIDLLDTHHVYDVVTTRNDLSCHMILPYDHDLVQLFGNQDMVQLSDQHGIDAHRDLHRLHKKYQPAVCIISNSGTTPIYVVRDSYLYNDETECTCVTTPRKDFFDTFPDLDQLMNSVMSQSWGMTLPGIILTCLGVLGTGIGGTLAYNSTTKKKWHMGLMYTGIVTKIVGIVLMAAGIGHKHEVSKPIKQMRAKRAALENYFQPKVVPGVVDLSTDIPALMQLLMLPIRYRAHKNVYAIHPGETLIEVVTIRKANVKQLKTLSLQHYDKNPHLIHAIHPSIHG